MLRSTISPLINIHRDFGQGGHLIETNALQLQQSIINLIINGRVDRIDRLEDGSLHVIDYKTGKSDESDTFQLLFYCLILSRTLTWPVSRISYLHLEDGIWQTSEVQTDDVLESQRKVILIASKIENETEYPLITGPLCRYCDFIELCEGTKE